MVLGKIVGKTSTTKFKFLIEGEAKKFQYLQILHSNGNKVLAQILEIEKESNKAIAHCVVIGYRDKEVLRGLRTPLEPGSKVENADDELVRNVLGLEKREGGYIGTLEGRDKLKVYLDLNKILTKHILILAKTGYGKSYVAGVLLEELIEKGVPILVIDPHGEYSSLKLPNDKDAEAMKKFDIKPKSYTDQIQEFGFEPHLKSLKLNSKGLESRELIHLLPARLSNAQTGALYSAMREMDHIDFDQLILQLEMEENNAKWTLINIIKYVKNLGIFSDKYTRANDLIKNGKVSIINLRGVQAEIQEIVVYKLLKDLFMERKKGNIPPFFLVLEEAQNFIPERTFGEAKSSGIIRQIFAEGRKFGLGACLISQRPSRVDKSAISQCSTQMILKITNPNDIRTVNNSLEGLTIETSDEIRNIPIGSAMVVGVVDLPIFVDVRVRKSKHGGESIQVIQKDVGEELMPLIKQRISARDMKLMGKKVRVKLIPCGLFDCGDFRLLVNLNNGELIKDVEKMKSESVLKKIKLNGKNRDIFGVAIKLKEFTASELFSKTNVQFSEIYDIVNSLTKEGYFVKEGDKFRVSRNFDVFSRLKDFAVYEEVDYGSIDFDEKLDKKFDVRNVRDLLSDFVDVKNEKECWLVSYS